MRIFSKHRVLTFNCINYSCIDLRNSVSSQYIALTTEMPVLKVKKARIFLATIIVKENPAVTGGWGGRGGGQGGGPTTNC